MRVSFRKMHGAGNDFVVLDEREAPLGLTAARIAALADRHRGIGCDQLVSLEPGNRVRFFNPDGGEAGACGNASRCVADLLMHEAGSAALTLHTRAGALPSRRLPDGRVEVDMGSVRLDWADIPLAGPADTLHLPLDGDPAALSVGNPHATLFGTDPAEATRLGPVLERHPIFPERANIGFATVLDPGRIALTVWERGAGLTLACGSGACAAAVNAHRRGLCGRRVAVELAGGVLDIAWQEDGHVLMAGPVASVFQGQVDLAAFAA